MFDPHATHRTQLLSLLRHYQPIDRADAARAEQASAFVEQELAAASRENIAGHLTASAWVVNTTGDKVLLLHHKKLNIWLQPGGHADGDFDLPAVALREVMEETGLTALGMQADRIFDIDIHTIPVIGETPQHLHYDVRFVCTADEAEVLVHNPESNAIAWVALDDVERYSTEESILRMRRKWLEWRP